MYFLQANEESGCYHDYIDNNILTTDYLCWIAYFKYEEHRYSETIHVNFSSTKFDLDHELSRLDETQTISINNYEWIMGARRTWSERNKSCHISLDAYLYDETIIWNIDYDIAVEIAVDEAKCHDYEITQYKEIFSKVIDSFTIIK